MQTYTVTFVKKSDLFEGYPEALEYFCELDLPFSFGDCSYSLIPQRDLLDTIKGECSELEDIDLRSNFLVIEDRVNLLGPGWYIDLEN